jgi:hypothetical protein
MAMSIFAGKIDDADVAKEVGLEFEKNQFDTRVQALTDPGAYAAARGAAFKTVEASVLASYKAAAKAFQAAGLSDDQAKKMALQAAQNEKQTQMAIMRVQFPDSVDNLYSVGAARETNKFLPTAPMSTRRVSAPRRRAAPKKKTTKRR